MRELRTRLVTVLIGALLLLPTTSAQAQQQPSFRSASTDELSKATTGGNNWLTFGGALNNQRYSTLNQINSGNVADLKGSWMTRLGSGRGFKYKFEADPIVIDGVMYLATGNDDVFALDATNGKKLWSWQSDIPQDIGTICCGWDNRGVAAGDGRIYSGLLDGSFAALDQKTGHLAWRTQLEDYKAGYSITGAARYFDGLVFTGIAGGEFGIRGRVYALDAKTGKEVWRFYTVPGPGESGGDSWPNDGSYQHGGGTVWQAPAVDPELGMLYFSTGNAGPWMGDSRPGDNLYTSSIVALDYKTGQYKWHFQQVHHDLWDLDSSSPVVLFDQTYNGQPRKGAVRVRQDRLVLHPGPHQRPTVDRHRREAGAAGAAPEHVADAAVPGRRCVRRAVRAARRRVPGTGLHVHAVLGDAGPVPPRPGRRGHVQPDVVQPADRLHLRPRP